MTQAQVKGFWVYIFKQTPAVVILMLVGYFEYQYFTNEIKNVRNEAAVVVNNARKDLVKSEAKIEKLEFKVDQLNNKIIDLTAQIAYSK